MKRLRISTALCAALAVSACASVDETFETMGLANPVQDVSIPNPVAGLRGLTASRTVQPERPPDDWSAANFQAWSPQTADYLLYPGDELEISVPSAPELSRQVTIGPDGRFNFPYAGAVMAANRSTPDVEASLSAALARDLLRPYVEITPVGYGSQKILVLGEVAQPGLYDLPGPMGALEAVAMAGGFTGSAATSNVWIVRRAPNGAAMQRKVNLRATLRGDYGGDYDVLARYDVVYVPRSGVANANRFIEQYIRNMVPFNIGFSYAIGDNYNGVSANASTP